MQKVFIPRRLFKSGSVEVDFSNCYELVQILSTQSSKQKK